MQGMTCGYLPEMTSVLAYVLVILLVPVALALMLFLAARIEGEPPPAARSRLPHAP